MIRECCNKNGFNICRGHPVMRSYLHCLGKLLIKMSWNLKEVLLIGGISPAFKSPLATAFSNQNVLALSAWRGPGPTSGHVSHTAAIHAFLVLWNWEVIASLRVWNPKRDGNLFNSPELACLHPFVTRKKVLKISWNLQENTAGV